MFGKQVHGPRLQVVRACRGRETQIKVGVQLQVINYLHAELLLGHAQCALLYRFVGDVAGEAHARRCHGNAEVVPEGHRVGEQPELDLGFGALHRSGGRGIAARRGGCHRREGCVGVRHHTQDAMAVLVRGGGNDAQDAVLGRRRLRGERHSQRQGTTVMLHGRSKEEKELSRGEDGRGEPPAAPGNSHGSAVTARQRS